MADQMISELEELDAALLVDDDLLVVVDASENKTKKLKYQTLNKVLARDNILKYQADDTGVALSNDAITDCLAANGTAYIPEGTFRVEDLEIDSGKIYGPGTLFRTAGNHCIKLSGESPTVDGITFNSSGSIVNGDAEINLMDGCLRPQIKNCRFTGSLYACVSADTNGVDDTSLLYAAQVDGFIFRQNKVEGGYSRHLYLHSVKNFSITDNHFRDSLRDCIRLRQATEKGLISGNTFDDIGEEYEEIVERPANWLSASTYTLGQEVSVPPSGIYRCIVASSTAGANPSTTGSAEWENIAPGFFETKDILDGFWSGVELVITNNIVNRCAGFGFDIKGSEPNGLYSTGKVVFSNNFVSNCFGTALNIHGADALLDGTERYTGQFIITNNFFLGNNRERIDIAQSPITLKYGVRNVIIANNIIQRNYARAITIANADAWPINKEITIVNNQLISNGIPGHPSNVGINCGPVDGLIIRGNTIRNLLRIEEYKMVVSGTATSDDTVLFNTRGNLATISVPVLSGDTAAQITAKIAEALDAPNHEVEWDSVTSYYYGNVRAAADVKAYDIDSSAQFRFTSALDGVLGEGKTVTITVSGTADLYPQPDDFVLDGSGNLSIEVRTSTKPFHLITAFNSNASAEVKALWQAPTLEDGVPTDHASQTAVAAQTLTMADGVDGTEVYFDAHVEDALTDSLGTFTGAGFTVVLSRQPLFSNSVQTLAMSIRDYETVGSTLFEQPKLSSIICDNICDNNSDSGDRYNIQYNFTEPPVLIAYVDSDNSDNNTALTTAARALFSGGTDSGATSHLHTQAYLIEQGITLKSRVFGVAGNFLSFAIEQQTGADQEARVTIAPALFGGREIILKLPTDGAGSPATYTVAEGEALLKQRLGQGCLRFENNYVGGVYIPQPYSGGGAGGGANGADGDDGEPGDSAYDVAVNNGFVGTEEEWLTSLEGADGIDGEAGRHGVLMHPVQGIELIEHWLGSTGVGQLDWALFTNSGSIGGNVTAASGKATGLTRLSTLTSATAAPTITLGSGTSLLPGAGSRPITMEYGFQVGNLATVAEDFIFRIGAFDWTTSTKGNDGIYLEYNRATSANWLIVCRAGGVETATDSGVAVAAGAFKKCKIEVNEDATSVEFFLADDVTGDEEYSSLGTVTANIPTGTSQATSPAAQMVKTAGTTERIAYLDWFYLRMSSVPVGNDLITEDHATTDTTRAPSVEAARRIVAYDGLTTKATQGGLTAGHVSAQYMDIEYADGLVDSILAVFDKNGTICFEGVDYNISYPAVAPEDEGLIRPIRIEFIAAAKLASMVEGENFRVLYNTKQRTFA